MMTGVTYGDVLFIVLVCGLIWGLTALMNRSRRAHPAKLPEIPDRGAGDPLMETVLRESRSVAVVGDFAAPDDRAGGICRFLRERGYTVHPVSVEGRSIEALSGFRTLEEIPVPPELVVVALPAGEAPLWAQRAVSAGARALWLEKGTDSPEAMRVAREGGLAVVMGHAVEEEHRRLLGNAG